MFSALQAGLLFLISSIFDLYIFILLVRVLLVWAGANYFDPFTQFIIKLTDFIIKPMRKMLPNWQRIETASVILILGLSIIKYFAICLLTIGFPHLIGILVLAGSDFIKEVFQILFYAVILQAILSWVQPYSPLNKILQQITSPLMQPLRRVIPLVNGIDITPIPALIILQLLMIAIASPLIAFGWMLAVGK